MPTLDAIREVIGGCREWDDETADRCNAPADYVLWGKLLEPEALGPRCYDCAAKHTGHRFLADSSSALVDLRKLTWAIDGARSGDRRLRWRSGRGGTRSCPRSPDRPQGIRLRPCCQGLPIGDDLSMAAMREVNRR